MDYSPGQLKKARNLIKQVRGCDRGRLDRLYRQAVRKKSSPQRIAELTAQIQSSVSERQRRLKSPPKCAFPSELPVSAAKENIVRAIREHQVLIISGETGSGKTTQIPKMCIEAGRGTDGLIGCTQPRRIAALSVADRIAAELGSDDLCGCKIRFHDSGKPENFIRVMTDGILLAEAHSHPALRAYDTIIVDEAHERSLNIDLLLGLLRRLTSQRRDLKIIITSATLDTEKFSKHFGDAPVIEVSGRTYPVEIRCEEPDAEMSLPEQCAHAVESLVRESPSGDILTFLPTEEDIKECIRLTSRCADRLNILPLYARLPSGEQKRVFVKGGKRKLIVATNVAETSLTIPGIKYVVDTGLARISRYNPASGTQQLPVEAVSRASADQRAGRCGRVANGICVRLYSQEDYESRPLYTLPEIRRTNLAEVILKLLNAGISDIEAFPFVDPPDPAGIRDGLRTLREVGALGQSGRDLTERGRLMARLPLDPRLSRVLLQAVHEGCLGDVLPIASALSLQDPRERPPEKAGSADAAHKAFTDMYSDLSGWLNIWDALEQRQAFRSGKLRRFCTEHFLSFRRMREWIDIHRQLTGVMQDNGFKPFRTAPAPSVDTKGHFTDRYAKIHRSVLSGFLSHIARHDQKDFYEATRKRKAVIHPGSALRGASHPWIIAVEMVHTSRLYARSCAAVSAEWLEELGADLAARNWIKPHWSRKAGAVMATEEVRLYGFLISSGKTVPYGPVRPAEAREIFIRSALTEGDTLTVFPFMKQNRKVIKKLQAMEEKLRRRDLVAGEDAVAAFYDSRLPADVLDTGTLNRHMNEKGWKHLLLTEDDLLTGVPDSDALKQFPDSVNIGGERWKIKYKFDTDSEQDGVTIRIPSGRQSELPQTDWIVPGLMKEKITALLRGLPKEYRRRLIPVPETTQAILDDMTRDEADLTAYLSAWLYRERRVSVPPDAWNPEDLPPHLRIRYSLLDESGRETAASRDAAEITKADSGTVRYSGERDGLTTWPDEDIPDQISLPGGAVLWPALVDCSDSVSLRFFKDRAEARAQHLAAQAVLARIHWNKELRSFRRLVSFGRIRPRFNAQDAVWNRVLNDIFASEYVRSQQEWQDLQAGGGRKIVPLAEEYRDKIAAVTGEYEQCRDALNSMAFGSHRPAFVKERLADLEDLLPDDFIDRYPPEDWTALIRWMKALKVRTRRGIDNPARDRRSAEIWEPLKQRMDKIGAAVSPLAGDEKVQAVRQGRLMIEELKVALFAGGEIKAAGRISESRMQKHLDLCEGLF